MHTGSYTGRDLNSLNCYINRKFKGLRGAVKAGKGPCAGRASSPGGRGGGREPLGPAPAAPAFPSWPRPCGGGGDPALQTKVNCFRCSRAWPPAPAPCAQVLRGLCSRGRAPEQHRPGYGWKGAGEREQEHNGRQPWGRVAGMWTLQGSFGF